MQIPKAVADALRVIAPTLAAGLAGPFAGVAASVVTAALDAWLGPSRVPPDAVPLPPGVPPPPSLGGATPEAVVEAVKQHAKDPQFVEDLRKAEMDLRRYEQEMKFRFAELEVKDRERAGDFQRDTGTAQTLLRWGMGIVTVSMAFLFAIVLSSLLLIANVITIPPETAQMAVGVFGVIGTIVGHLSGYGGQILSFYFGSSKGSDDKNAQIANTVRDLGSALGDAANRPAPIPIPVPVLEPSKPPAPAPSGDEPAPQPAEPAPSGLLSEILPRLTQPHRHFDEGVSWQMTMEGISVDGAPAEGTPGEPATIRGIWRRYGELCLAAARQYGVPVELIVATIATESKGDPNAHREEPQIGDASTGLMQTLLGTARAALGRPELRKGDLLDPATSIMAGTAYIAQQRGSTHFDPPLVLAAYNAGSVRKDLGEKNRWKLRCHPIGTGRHVDNGVAWFGDCMRVSAQEGWGSAEGVPAFASCLLAAIPVAGKRG